MTDTSTDKSADPRKILLLEGIHPSAVTLLREAGYSHIECHAGALSGPELQARIADAEIVGIRSRTQLTAEVFAKAGKLKAVGCFCIGTNQVDLQAALAQGVAVFNAPYANTRSVAELVLAQAILLLRGVPARNAAAHRGEWRKSAEQSYEIRGKTLGIIGYGSIGSQLSVLAEALGMRVQFFDVVSKLPMGNATQVATLAELLAQADVLSLHVPETPATEWMLGSAEIARMKPTAVLINAARGRLVVLEALAAALREKRLLGAAVDVFPLEPGSNQERFESPLRGLDQALLTPHIGGSTLEAQERIGVEVAEKLVKYDRNGTSTSSVNFPEVALPAYPGKHRMLHIHRNVPGVLALINQVFSDNHINVAAQYLQTRDSLGYVVIDIDSQDSQRAWAGLQKVPGTLSSRILF